MRQGQLYQVKPVLPVPRCVYTAEGSLHSVVESKLLEIPRSARWGHALSSTSGASWSHMAPLLDARTANGGGNARIEKRRVGLFVAGPEAVTRSVTPRSITSNTVHMDRHHATTRTWRLRLLTVPQTCACSMSLRHVARCDSAVQAWAQDVFACAPARANGDWLRSERLGRLAQLTAAARGPLKTWSAGYRVHASRLLLAGVTRACAGMYHLHQGCGVRGSPSATAARGVATYTRVSKAT